LIVCACRWNFEIATSFIHQAALRLVSQGDALAG
jgi:hypothetical protein